MTNRELAIAFLDCFCVGDVEGLAALLAEDLFLNGPFHQSASRQAYLAVLREDPPEPCNYRLWSLTEDEEHAAVFYDYETASEKPDGALAIAQLFTCKAH